MAITKNPDRQDILVSRTEIGFADMVSDAAVAEEMVVVPDGAIVIGGYVLVTEAFDSTTSDVLDVGDGGDDDRYSATPIDLTALGVNDLDVTGYKYLTKDTIDGEWTAGSTGTATAGAFEIVVEYIIEGRSAFPQK